MCGIAGLLQTDAPIDPLVPGRMRDTLRHRGPDDAGLYRSPCGRVALGHRRLSIIDLSDQGRQPMANEDGTVWIVFNGEIYNFPELRPLLESRGHRFRSRTDTEVILHAYEEFGDACVERLSGMFAFAIWDSRRGRLFLSRDRFGIKPLYYHAGPDVFAFASELKALAACPRVPREPDPSAIYDFLSYRYVPTPKTVYRAVRKLPAATALSVDLAGNRFETAARRYWDIQFPPATPAPPADPVRAIRKQLAGAVESHLVSDVPLGTLLSGGVDSSLVVGILSRLLQRPVETFTVGFDAVEHSEAAHARRAAEIFGTRHHEITVSLGSLEDALREVVRTYDEPFADGSAVPTRRVCEFARQHVKVALAGDGGDELFGGYGWYGRWLALRRHDRWWSWLPQERRERWQRRIPGGWKTRNFGRTLFLTPLEQYLRLVGAFTRYEKTRFLHPDFARDFADYDDVWQLRQHWRPDLDPLSALQYLDLRTYLPDDILTKVDRASMAVSLEVRVPFLDPAVAEAAARLPLEWRRQGDSGKLVLKRILAEWLPDDAVQRPKQGFSAPWGRWLQPEAVRDRLRQGELVRRGLFDADALAALPARQFFGGKGWTLLVLEQWFQENRR